MIKVNLHKLVNDLQIKVKEPEDKLQWKDKVQKL
jgi:hypothetical protein